MLPCQARSSSLLLLLLTLTLLAFFVAFGDAEARRGSRFRLRDSPSSDEAESDKSKSWPSRAANRSAEYYREKEGKAISLFSIVRFANTACRTGQTTKSNNARNGTCFTAIECSRKSGENSGVSCAGGFGICCIFATSTSSANVNQNCSYLRNPGYPSTLTTTTQVTYTVSKCQCDVCFIRLDFECFTILGTPDTMEVNGGECQDTFAVNSGTGATTPTICGDNTGKHLYVDIGRNCNDDLTLTFSFTGTSTTRQWEIKASQIPCGSNYSPPAGCHEWLTSSTGRITSFNFNPTGETHIQNQDHCICIRNAMGNCCIQYSPCADANSYSLGKAMATAGMAFVDTQCTEDYIEANAFTTDCTGGGTTATANRLCGTIFNIFAMGTIDAQAICDCTPDFKILIHTDAMSDEGTAIGPNTAMSRGICLDYSLVGGTGC